MVSMRLGVLDVGSNTVHLLVVDAHRGARPTPMTSNKTELRLAERIDASGRLTDEGAEALVAAVGRAAAEATAAGCDEVLAFATSALRDATNSDAVAARVRAHTGLTLQLLPGADEARYTFLAARRWCGWSAGRLLVLDIGGGSLELAVGADEHPDHAESVLSAAELGQLLAFITRMSSRDLADRKGVSPGRAHQLVAGTLVARAAVRALHVAQLEICPWALREGVIFRRLDTLGGRAHPAPAHEGFVPALRRTAATG